MAKQTHVILLTNLSQEEDVVHGFKLGANDDIVKSKTMFEEIVVKVKSLLS